MKLHPLPRIARLLLLVGLGASVAQAQEKSDATPASAPEDKTIHKINGIFDTELPKTERKGTVRFIVHPHLGDFTSRSYVRVPLGVRWGVNDHVEFSATVEPYFGLGFRHGPKGNGIGDVQFGGKYAFRDGLRPDYEASTGINVMLPVGKPPLDMTDGYDHFTPYLVVSHKSRTTAGLTYFLSPSLDVMEKSSVSGAFRKNDPHSTSLLFGSGFVLDRFPYHYTFEAGYQTTSLVGKGNKQFVFVKPGFAWDLPRQLTFDSHGRWLLGLSIKIMEGPDGTRVDSGGKLRGEINISRWFRRDKGDTVSPAPGK